jgi:hypothetical protein
MSDWGRTGTQCVAASGRKKSLETYINVQATKVRRNRVSGKSGLRRKAYRPRRASTREEEESAGDESKQSE